MFARYRRDLTQLTPPYTGEADSDPLGNSIFMSENFRCDESVIRVTNAVCGHILRACPDTVGYQPDDDLVWGKKPPSENYVSPKVQVAVLIPPSRSSDSTDNDTDEQSEDISSDPVGIPRLLKAFM